MYVVVWSDFVFGVAVFLSVRLRVICFFLVCAFRVRCCALLYGLFVCVICAVSVCVCLFRCVLRVSVVISRVMLYGLSFL